MTIHDAVKKLEQYESWIDRPILRAFVKLARTFPTAVTEPDDEGRRVLAELRRCYVDATKLHEPVRTEDGDPAHGCECCDGEHYCSCTERCRGPRCLVCGGEWPFCDPDFPEYDPKRSTLDGR